MLPAELMKQIRLLEIRTNRIVDEITGGAYHSVFKGRGIEFDEVREYADGDDARDIDWNVSARMGTPYIKKYVEERELNILLLVDVSASGAFGSGEKSKRRTAAELAALLAFSAGRNGDKAGMMLFSDCSELILPPRSGRSHTLRLVREMLAFEPRRRGTDLAGALREAGQLLRKRSIIFVLSDWIEGGDYEKTLKIVNRRHDVVAVRIRDAAELDWELPAAITAEDAESGRLVAFSGRRRDREEYRREALAELRDCNKICERAQVDLIDLECGADPLRPLIDFFNRRRRRLRNPGQGGKP